MLFSPIYDWILFGDDNRLVNDNYYKLRAIQKEVSFYNLTILNQNLMSIDSIKHKAKDSFKRLFKSIMKIFY